MKNLEDLKLVTEKTLCCLSADESLKHKILQKALIQKDGEIHKPIFRPIPVLCVVMAVLVLSVCLLNGLQPVTPVSQVDINVFAAGSTETEYTENASDDHDGIAEFSRMLSDNVLSIELTGAGIIDDAGLCASLIETLKNDAASVETDFSEEKSLLIIQSSNGTTYQFSVNEPLLMGDKCWSCPEFFSQLHDLLQK